EGTYVADVIGTVFEPPMVDLVRRHQQAIFDYLEFRRDIEGTAAAYAAERATDADLTILERIFRLMVEAHARADPDEEARLDVEFHTAIIEAAHNVVLLHMMRSCYRLLAEGVFYNRQKIYANPAWRDELLDQHRAIHDAIKARDRDAAQGAARAHMDFVETALHKVDRTDARTEISQLRLQKFTGSTARQRA
ncbi:MAG TPA: FCD domain-containing protein, partial [Afifellaceae bacterium]|nr:FCD domain-containing protein [Afifellaceae bacterium]